jgi:hypothetical protein
VAGLLVGAVLGRAPACASTTHWSTPWGFIDIDQAASTPPDGSEPSLGCHDRRSTDRLLHRRAPSGEPARRRTRIEAARTRYVLLEIL